MDSSHDFQDDPNVIPVWDEQGELVETIHIDLCNQMADHMMTSLMDLEGELEHFDFSTAAFGLFVNCVHILVNSGWSIEELTREVQQHGAMQEASQGVLN